MNEITINPAAILPWLTLLSFIGGFLMSAMKRNREKEQKLNKIEEKLEQVLDTVNKTQDAQTFLIKGVVAALDATLTGEQEKAKKAREEIGEFLVKRK